MTIKPIIGKNLKKAAPTNLSASTTFEKPSASPAFIAINLPSTPPVFFPFLLSSSNFFFWLSKLALEAAIAAPSPISPEDTPCINSACSCAKFALIWAVEAASLAALCPCSANSSSFISLICLRICSSSISFCFLAAPWCFLRFLALPLSDASKLFNALALAADALPSTANSFCAIWNFFAPPSNAWTFASARLSWAFAASNEASAVSKAASAKPAALIPAFANPGSIWLAIVLPNNIITPNKAVVLSAKVLIIPFKLRVSFTNVNIPLTKSPNVAPNFW